MHTWGDLPEIVVTILQKWFTESHAPGIVVTQTSAQATAHGDNKKVQLEFVVRENVTPPGCLGKIFNFKTNTPGVLGEIYFNFKTGTPGVPTDLFFLQRRWWRLCHVLVLCCK